MVHKTARMIPTTICHYVTKFLKMRFLEESRAFSLWKMLWAGRSQVSNSGKGKCFLWFPKRPDWLWGPHILLVSLYCHSSPGIKGPGREPNNSSALSAEVIMLSTKVPLVLRFQLNEQR